MVLKIHEKIHGKGFEEKIVFFQSKCFSAIFHGLPSWEVDFGVNFCSVFKRQQREVRNRESQVLCGTRQEERAWCTLS